MGDRCRQVEDAVKLTDEELAAFEALSHDVARNGSECDSTAEKLARDCDAVIAELRSLRALLATPLPDEFVAPRVVVMRGHGAEDMVQWVGDKPLFHNEAIALGAALIRAALAAQTRTPGGDGG